MLVPDPTVWVWASTLVVFPANKRKAGSRANADEVRRFTTLRNRLNVVVLAFDGNAF